jgi:hypothetical protein
MARHRFRGAAIGVVAAVVAACGGSSSSVSPTPTPAASTSFSGTIAGPAGQTGTLTVTISAQVARIRPRWMVPIVATVYAQSATVAATGSVHLAGGSTTTVTGTYDTTSKALAVSGGGYTFTGTASGGAVTGTYTAPGVTTGLFATRSTAAGTVTSYCGNVFSAGNPNQSMGVFNLAVTDATGTISGAFNLGQYYGQITGQATGSNFSISWKDNFGEPGNGTGTIASGALSGSSNTNNPFSGRTSACQ